MQSLECYVGGDVRNPRVDNIHLLKRITLELREIQTLFIRISKQFGLQGSILGEPLHDVEGRMNSIRGRLLQLLDFWVDGWQNWCIIASGRLAGNADLFFTHRGPFEDVLCVTGPGKQEKSAIAMKEHGANGRDNERMTDSRIACLLSRR